METYVPPKRGINIPKIKLPLGCLILLGIIIACGQLFICVLTISAAINPKPTLTPTLLSTFTPLPTFTLAPTLTSTFTFTPLPTETNTLIPTQPPLPTATTFISRLPEVPTIQPATGDGNSGYCCKVCGATSKACGDSCIYLSKTCHKPPGCACD